MDGATGNMQTADVWTADVTPPDGATVEDEAVTTVFSTVDHAALAKAQAASPEVQDHLAGRHPDGVTVKWIEFIPGTSLLCDVATGKSRPLVPIECRDIVIRAFHGLGHPGQAETVRRVQKRYYWPSLRKDVSQYVAQCIPCQQVKVGRTITPPIKNRPVLAPRFSDLMLDIIGPVCPSEGNSYILTILDRTSRWVDAVPMASATAEACSKAFIRSWVKTFGLCDMATTDNGPSFVSKVWAKVHENLGTIVSYTPPLHPSSLGHLERQHRDIKVGLKTALLDMAEQYQGEWCDALPWVLLGRHAAYQPDLGASPAEIVFGACLKLPGDLVRDGDPEAADVSQLVDALRINAAQPPRQTAHHRHLPTYWPASAEKATHVFLRKGKTTPLGPTYEGPFPITEKYGDSCIQVQVGVYTSGTPRLITAHWNNCKPAVLKPGAPTATRTTLGRPKKAAK